MPLQFLPKKPAPPLLLIVMSLVGCGTTSPPPALPPANPLPPATSTALPSVDYSISAQENIKAWRKQLKVTPTM